MSSNVVKGFIGLGSKMMKLCCQRRKFNSNLVTFHIGSLLRKMIQSGNDYVCKFGCVFFRNVKGFIVPLRITRAVCMRVD